MSGHPPRRVRRGVAGPGERASPAPLPEHALLALQRTAGNRAVTGMLQRYFIWSQADAGKAREAAAKEVDVVPGTPAYLEHEVGVEPGATAPSFPSQLPGKTGEYTEVVSTSIAGVSSLKIADKGDLAIENVTQPKTFFASKDRLAESNEVLERARSAYALEPQPETLKVGQQELVKLMPRNRLTDTEGLQATSLHRCNEMANRVIGQHYTFRPARAMKDAPVDAELAAVKEMVIKEVFADLSFAAAYQHLSPEQRRQLGEATGINEFADPKLGEAYEIASRGEIVKGKHWNVHWAGVVAKSDGDNVTLENYNRTPDDEGKSSAAVGVRGEDIDVRWFFQMYGTQHPAQTFHARQAGTPFFSVPITERRLKDQKTVDAQQEALKSVDTSDPRAVRHALRELHGIVDEESRAEVKKRAEAITQDEALVALHDRTGSIAERLTQYLEVFVKIPHELVAQAVRLLTTRDHLTNDSAAGEVGKEIGGFCKGFSLTNYRFDESKWQVWAAKQ